MMKRWVTGFLGGGIVHSIMTTTNGLERQHEERNWKEFNNGE